MINFGLATLMTLTAACSGAVDPNVDPTGGTGGVGGGENGGGGTGGNLPFDSSDIQLNDFSIEPVLGLSAADIADAFTAGDAVPAAELEPTFENNDFSVNVHAFSYDGRLVGINQRTVNESAAVVQYLADHVFGD